MLETRTYTDLAEVSSSPTMVLLHSLDVVVYPNRTLRANVDVLWFVLVTGLNSNYLLNVNVKVVYDVDMRYNRKVSVVFCSDYVMQLSVISRAKTRYPPMERIVFEDPKP